MIPTTAKTPPKGEGWVHEVKTDGYRFQVVKNGDRIRLFSRSEAEYTDRLPVMAEAFSKLPARLAVLDGELSYIGPGWKGEFLCPNAGNAHASAG
jgi:bifunctional non-homologous end joining protein LigD